jgi:hypothetical protein
LDGTEDEALAVTIEITVAALLENKPLFPSIFDEPYFYRKHFKHWVAEGMQELRAIEDNKPNLFPKS